jgi:hypothetical protein
MQVHRYNWLLWAGLLLSVSAFLSYFFVFVWFPVTRDVPWANLLLFGIAALFVLGGIRRAWAPEQPRRAKIVAAVLATLSVALGGGFVYVTSIMARHLPAAQSAPQIGQQAPDFRLADTQGTPVALAELLAAPINGHTPKGVLLVFYRGAW